MKLAEFELDDGRIAQFEVEDGVTEQEVMEYAKGFDWGSVAQKTQVESPEAQEYVENHQNFLSNLVDKETQDEWRIKGEIGIGEAYSKLNKWKMLPFLNGKEAIDSLQILNLVNRHTDGETLTDEEKNKVREWYMDMVEVETRGFTTMGHITNGLLQMPAFAGEFAVTGGLLSLGKKAALKTGQVAVKEAVKKGITETIKRGVVGTAKLAATGAARTVLMPHRVANTYAETRLGDGLALTDKGEYVLQEVEQKPATTVMRAFGDVMIENISEQTGEAILAPLFGRASKFAKGMLPEKFTKAFTELAEKTTNSTINNAMKSMGYNGLLEEIGEERIGDLLRTTFDLDEQEGYSFDQFIDALAPDAQQLLIEAGVIGVWGGASRATQIAVNKLSNSGVKNAQDVVNNLSETQREELANRVSPETAETEARYNEQKQNLINQMVDTGVVDVQGAEQVATLIDARVAASAEVLKMTKSERLQELAIEIQKGVADEFMSELPVEFEDVPFETNGSIEQKVSEIEQEESIKIKFTPEIEVKSADEIKSKVEDIQQEVKNIQEETENQGEQPNSEELLGINQEEVELNPNVPEQTIQDFGEKIAGAKKELWAEYKKSLEAELPADVANISLAKHLPKPDYDALIAGGYDIETLATIKVVRDLVPNKPKKPYQIEIWANKVKQVRNLITEMLSENITHEQIMKKVENEPALMGLRYYLDEGVAFYKELGYPAFTKAEGYVLRNVRLLRDAEGKETRQQKFTAFKKGKQKIPLFDTRQEALDYLRNSLTNVEPTKKEVQFDIYQIRSTKEIIIGKKIASGKFVDLKTGFKTASEARAYLAENRQALLSLLEKKKELPNERRLDNSERIGENYRKGLNVTPEQFLSEFGFRGVQFGNYVEQSKRLQDINQSYDSFLDLATLTNLPAKALSLNGELGLAFGARGVGGKGAAKAHYERSFVVINLTKKEGAGSLAHEWWHALDNYFGKRTEKAEMLSETGGIAKSFNIRPELFDSFQELKKTIKDSKLVERSRRVDSTRTKDYWSTDVELTARAFEAYIINKAEQFGMLNDYLANILSPEAWEIMEGSTERYLYPIKEELSTISQAFDKFFDTIKTRETEKGIELYQGERGDLQPTINIDGIEKPTVNSEGKPIASTEQGVRNFYKWFGDSKVVDSEGKPLVVYHGTDAEFDTFDFNKLGTEAQSKFGFWFTNQKEFAEFFGDKVMNSFITIKKPKTISLNKWNEIRDAHFNDIAFFENWKAELIAEGFDGLAVKGKKHKIGEFNIDDPVVFAVFNPEQIKSVDNTGEFSQTNPNIYKQDARGAIQLGKQNIITLFEGADKSTILHELGHLFLRDMERLSTIADNAQLKQEMETVRTWVKNDGGAFTIEQQEQFARGFEQYLRTGKAPTSKLAQAFDKFKEWLRSVYSSAKMLKADITPDVARVFDSMLMTEAEKVETGFYEKPTEFETLFQNSALAFADNIEAQRILDNIEYILDLEGEISDSDLKDIRKEVRKLREIEPTQAKVQIKKDIKAVEEVVKSKEEIVKEQVRRLEKKLAKQKRDLEMQEPVPEEQYETVLNMTDTADDLLKSKGLSVKSGDRLGRKLFVPISTRLGEIDKRLKHTMRKFEFNVNIRKNKDMEKIKGFFDKVQNLSEEDYKILDFAMKNIDLKKIDEIATKYDMQDDVKNIRDLLDDIRSRAIKVGIDVNLVENYFPRSVENPDAYLTWLKGTENWTYIDRQLKEAKMENSTNDEKAEFINLMLARYDIKEFKERLFKSTKPTMQRKFTRITPEMNAFYKDSSQALLNYIGSMNNLIEAKKFWGLDKLNDESIGGIIKDMIVEKGLTVSEETELKDILRARFGQLGARGIVRAYKNMTYIYSMGSISSAITQIGDLGLSLYKNGFYNTMDGITKALSKDKITKQDLGVEAIAQEFMDETKSANAVRKVFKLVGLEFMDNLGKETTINASLSRLQQEARKPTKRFENYINDIFGSEAEQTIKDLKDGNITENVKYILFSELSDLQPISLAEMPEGYLTGGNSRIFYMLKTYTIKLFDIYRNDVYMKIAKGNDDEVKEGIRNLIRLSISLMLTGATSDIIKDILFNRELNFNDLMLDNILKLFGFSKWQIYKARKEGLGATLLQTILPPVPFFDDLYKDIMAVAMNKKGRDIKDFRTWKGIPLVGKLYYWWFGGGSEQKK